MEEGAAVEGEEAVEEAVAEEEVEEAKQQEELQQEEETRNSLGRSLPPSTGTDKMSINSCQISWDTCPSTEITLPLHHSSPGSTSPYPLLREKKYATGRIACAHGPITF